MHVDLPRFPASRIFRAALASNLLFAIGCSVAPAPNAGAVSVAGNWQLSSAAPAAARLPRLSGALTGSGSAITGIFHADSASACVSPSTPIPVTGSVSAHNAISLTGSLTGSSLPGGVLTVTGTLADDGKSIANASYTVAGGSCAFAADAPATAQVFASIDGTYTGNFSDSTGVVASLTAQLTQTPASDTDGNFQLSGTGSLNNPCFTNPVQVSNSQVTGGSFTLTYADPNTQNSVTASGTFSTSGQTLTVTNWTLTGPCGPAQGTGLLSQ